MKLTYSISSLLVFTLFLLMSCKFNPNVQGSGDIALQGIWEQEPSELQDSLLQYTRHQFKFTCDSFYATLSTTSRVNYYDDNCYNSGQWKEYAKGNYVVNKDTLYIIGTFTKDNYRQKLTGCYRIGQYLPVFLIKHTSPERIELLDLQQNIPVILRLKEKLTCHPQPL